MNEYWREQIKAPDPEMDAYMAFVRRSMELIMPRLTDEFLETLVLLTRWCRADPDRFVIEEFTDILPLQKSQNWFLTI